MYAIDLSVCLYLFYFIYLFILGGGVYNITDVFVSIQTWQLAFVCEYFLNFIQFRWNGVRKKYI